jgi:hypothetical protein
MLVYCGTSDGYIELENVKVSATSKEFLTFIKNALSAKNKAHRSDGTKNIKSTLMRKNSNFSSRNCSIMIIK